MELKNEITKFNLRENGEIDKDDKNRQFTCDKGSNDHSDSQQYTAYFHKIVEQASFFSIILYTIHSTLIYIIKKTCHYTLTNFYIYLFPK
jgi:hypothetical protein